MKIQMIVVFKLINMTITRSKIKFTESDVTKNSRESISISPNQFNHSKIKLIKNDENYEEFEELLKYLDCINVPELSNEELNNYSPVTLNDICLSEILDIEQISKTEKQCNFAKELPSIVQSNHVNAVCTNFNSSNVKNQIDVSQKVESEYVTEDCYKNLPEIFDSKIDKNNNHPSVINDKISRDIKLYPKKRLIGFKSYIEKYISDNVPCTYNGKFLKRIQTIEEACQIIDNYQLNEKTYFFIFEPSHDKELIDKLNVLTSKFNKNLEFNKENFEVFEVEFNLKIYNSINFKEILINLAILPDVHKRPFFYQELIKFYKHVSQLPDLLAFGGLFSNKSYRKIIVIMHVINLFIDNIGNVKDNNFFILCMICISFKCFYGSQYDFFRNPHLECECNLGRHDLRNFSWEFNSKMRRKISLRKFSKSTLNSTDRILLKTVLMLYLYQHIIYMKVQNVSVKTAHLFTAFIEKVVDSKECVPCLFNEYLCKK